MIQSYKDLEVYKRAFDLAMQIFESTRTFPKEEVYSLTSQIVRSSRSVAANISEGWAKREYEQVFKQHLIHALGSVSETQTWIDFSLKCSYINTDTHAKWSGQLDIIGKMITNLHKKWKSK